MSYIPNPLCPCVEYVPDPLVLTPPSDPCVTEAQRLGRLTQALTCPGSTPPLTDLLAYWELDEPTGVSPREDSHTGNYDLTTPGGVTSVTSSTGKISNGASLTGSPGVFLENSNAALGLTGPMTLAGWIYVSSITLGGGGQYVIGKTDMTAFAPPNFATAGYMIYINASGNLAFWQGNGATSAEVVWPIVPSYGAWHYIVAGYTGSQSFIQVNNGTRQTGSGLTPTAGSQSFMAGGAKAAGSPTSMSGPDAIFDEWGLWLNRAISTTDASYLYNGGFGRTYPFS